MSNSEVENLNTRFGIPEKLRFVEKSEGFIVAEITNAHASASIALQGAHLMTWQPRHQPAPVIWLSEAAKLAKGKSIRGGVPVCWPWFGAHSDPAKPAHGYARTVPWQVTDVVELSGGETEITFELVESDATRAMWPLATPVRAVITVGAELAVVLITRNNQNEPITLSEALHTYFQVSDIEKVEVQCLSGTTYADKVEGMQRKVQEGTIRIHSEVDRVYVNTEAECVIVDTGYGRKILIGKSNSRSTVVWNPWIEKADKMGDLGDEGYRHMLCVESGNALEDAVTISPGGEHQLAVVYRVETL